MGNKNTAGARTRTRGLGTTSDRRHSGAIGVALLAAVAIVCITWSSDGGTPPPSATPASKGDRLPAVVAAVGPMQAPFAVAPVAAIESPAQHRQAQPLPPLEPVRGPSPKQVTLPRTGVGGGLIRAEFTFDYRVRDPSLDRAAAALIGQHWPAARDEVMGMLAGRPLREFQDGVRQVEADMIRILDRAIFARDRSSKVADVTGIFWHSLLFQ